MLSEDMVESINPDLNSCRTQTKEDHARVRLPILEYKQAIVRIIGNENPTFPLGKIQNLRIRESGSMVPSDGSNVMSKGTQMDSDPDIGILIEEKSHTRVVCLEIRCSRSLTTL